MRRTYSTYRQTADKPSQNYSGVQKRPFKKVRATAGGLVPYGPTRYYAPRPIGARGVSKGLDTSINEIVTTDMSTNEDIKVLNLIQAGTGSWNRVGRIVTMKSIRLRMKVTFTLNSLNADASARQFRYIIVYDKQPNGTIPVKSDIIQYKTQDGTETGLWNGYLSYDNMERFTILKDNTIQLQIPPRTFDSAGAPKNTQTVEHFEECYLRLNHITNYKSESAPMTIADISTGALYLVYLTDGENGSIAVQESVSRLRYTDQ